ncbi:hypothetical protein P376_5448 [Streptomyces sp. HCCB10043]|nr:hypothetical protein P376_5448 [Streptomyces sp. HCCB10043]
MNGQSTGLGLERLIAWPPVGTARRSVALLRPDDTSSPTGDRPEEVGTAMDPSRPCSTDRSSAPRLSR